MLRLGLWERQRITPNPLISQSLRQRQQCAWRELPVFKETARGEVTTAGEMCVCAWMFWSVRHRTWVSPLRMHSTITTSSSPREVGGEFHFILLNLFQSQNKSHHPHGWVYFDSRGCSGPLSPWLDPRNVWVRVGCSGQGVRRESGWLIEPALGGGGHRTVRLSTSALFQSSSVPHR